jgi:broad specificity phosphatase PhoE
MGTNKVQHGESQYNLDGRIGGDTLLSGRGEAYAKKLPELVRKSVGVRSIMAETAFRSALH